MENIFMRSKVKAPCKDCKDRFSGCHSECDKYLEFRHNRDLELEHNYQQKRRENLFR